MSYQEAKRQRDLALLRSLGYVEEPEEPAEPEGPPNFDGGVREPVPPQRDANQDHNALIAELLTAKQAEGPNIDFWSMAPKSPPAADSGEEPDQGEDWRKGGT